MRSISVFIIALLIIACKNSAKKKDDTKDTAKQVKQMPVTPAVPDTVFTGFGTEPFWLVYVVQNNKIVFHPADGTDVEVPFVVAATPDNITRTYNSVSGSSAIELTIIKKSCGDGMSEQTHPYEVKLVVNKTKYAGCGRDGK